MLTVFLHIMYFNLFYLWIKIYISNCYIRIARGRKNQMYKKENNSHPLETPLSAKHSAGHCAYDHQPSPTSAKADIYR